MKPALRTFLYVLAAMPAAYLPLLDLAMCAWVVITIVSGGGMTPSEGSPMWWACWLAIWATLFQWPFYLAWAAFSRGLSIRLRVAWMIWICLGNMVAMPHFLYCKYNGTTRTGLTRGMREGRLRRFLEKGMEG